MHLLRFVSAAAASAALLLAGAAAASASVLGVTVADASTGDYTLTSVTVNRSGAGTFTYLPGQLTGVDLTDVDAFSVPILVPNGASLPAAGTRATLIEDGRLDTGVINVTTINGTPDRSVERTFDQPVVNSAGADILVFNIGNDDGIRWWINDDRAGQSADLPSSSLSANLLSGITLTQYKYLPNGGNILSLDDLESDASNFAFDSDGSSTVNAFELDLSSVGVASGASVNSIRLQSLTSGGRADPVLVAGLPAVPEPASLALAGSAAAVTLLGRRRRHRRVAMGGR
jgi:hypothetical protein